MGRRVEEGGAGGAAVGVTDAFDRVSRPELQPVWDEVARRMGASERSVTSVTVRHLTDESRTAVADLLGLDRLPPVSPRLRIADLARAVGAVDEVAFRSVVEAIAGHVGNRSAVREQRRAERAALWAWVESEAARLDLGSWSSWLRSVGIPGGDVASHRARIGAAIAVLDRLQQDEGSGLVLAHLASDVLGDPHALDPGHPAAGLVVEALNRRSGGAGERRAEVVRAVWAAAGVATDTLSPTVLVHGVRSDGDDPVAATLAAMASAGESTVLTAHQLQRWPVQPIAGEDVVVVENPSLVAYFASSGGPVAGGSVVCTGGWPNVAVLTLLRQFSEGGSRLRCHADFDPAGILITRFLIEQVGAEPWEMTETAYLAAAGRSAVQFDGSVADTPWDPALADAMRAHRHAVFEEDVRRSLST